MANSFFRILYILGCICPTLIIVCLLYLFVNKEINLFVIVTLVIALLLLIHNLYFPNFMMKICAPMKFTPVKTPKANDFVANDVIFNLLCGVGEYALVNWKLWLLMLICTVLLAFSNRNYRNIFYPLFGYHYHTIESAGGGEDLIISKKRCYRNKDEITLVIRIFDGLLMDVS